MVFFSQFFRCLFEENMCSVLTLPPKRLDTKSQGLVDAAMAVGLVVLIFLILECEQHNSVEFLSKLFCAIDQKAYQPSLFSLRYHPFHMITLLTVLLTNSINKQHPRSNQ